MEQAIDEAGPRRTLHRASIVAAGTAYRQVLSFASGLIVARVIGAAEFGIFNLARNLVEVTGILTRLGLDLGLQRYFGETASTRDTGARVMLLNRLRLLTSLLALVPLIAVGLGLGRVLEDHVYQHSGFAQVLLCLALALPFLTDMSVLGGAYRGILKLAPPVLAEAVLLPTIRLAIILLLFAAGWRLWAVAVGTTLGSVAAAAWLAWRARSDFPSRPPAEPQSWLAAYRVACYSVVLAGCMIVTALTANMDLFMLGHFVSAQELGQYSLVKTLLVLTGVFGASCGQGLEALVADRHARGDFADMVRVMRLNARLIAFFTLPVFAIFLFWGSEIALLFGPSFAVSQAVVAWLAVAPYVYMICWPAGCALSMTGRHFLELKILLVGLVIATVLCWFAVPVYGQLGAAVAMCVSVVVANLLRLGFVHGYLRALPFGPDVFLITAAGVALAGASHAAVSSFALPWFWNLALGIGCFAAAYVAAAWFFLLTPSERSGIRAAIRKVVPA